MRSKKFSFFLIALMGISTILLVTNIPLVGAQAADLTAPTVTGAMTVDGADDETFWADATSQTFSLTATPGTTAMSANQRSVTMKAVITDTKIRVYFEWLDSSESEGTTGHEDRLALMILMEGANDMDSPCMNASTNGATTSGTADQWHWKAGRTDSGGAKHTVVTRRGVAYNTGGTATTYGGHAVDANSAIYYEENSTSSGWDLSDMGGAIGDQVYYVTAATGSARWSISDNTSAIPLVVDSHDFSFAENEYLNTVERARSGDSEYTGFGVLPSALSGEERYFINAKGDHDGSGWSLEMERDLAVTNAVIDKAFAAGDTIKVAIAVYDGAYDHDHEMKYITSAWKTVLLQGPVTTSPGIPGYSVVLLGLVAFGTIGIIYVSIKRRK